MIILVNPIKVELVPTGGPFNTHYIAVKAGDEEIGRLGFIGVNRLSLHDKRTDLVYEVEPEDDVPMMQVLEMLLNQANLTLKER